MSRAPATVSVPLRVIADRSSLESRVDDLADATFEGTRRALVDAVARLESGYGPVAQRAVLPHVSWAGAGLADVSPAVREAVERAIVAAIGGAVSTTLPSTVEAAGLLWTPYRGEPALTDLVVPDSMATALRGLRDDMHTLAAQLGVPESDYPGRFVLNCVEAVIIQARRIAVASADSAVTTQVTVRPDGEGNAGYVDIRPGHSRDLDELRRLAAAVPTIGRLQRGVLHAYGNSALVWANPGRFRDAGGWGLAFQKESDPVRAYRHLFAETCRVLLLQQLRSSRAGLAARLLRLDDTVEAFTQVLTILGEPIVRYTTLRLAIEHSQRLWRRGYVGEDGNVDVTGRVGDLLAIPTGTSGEESNIPPIVGVPAKILDAVADAPVELRGRNRVVVFQGRDWTVDQLDAQTATVRAVVNRVDPIFLQVSDLEGVYREAQVWPGSVLTYVVKLLTSMGTANARLTEKARQPSWEGAAFAVEASQYVRRSGSRHPHRPHFDLQGIHALADGILGPAVGQDERYADGVNAALAPKANRDDLLAAVAVGGVIALSLICAPLGEVAVGAIAAAANIGLAVHDVRVAERQSDLFHALENPELFVRWQDVQLAELMAGISVAFSVFDVAGLRAGRAIVAESWRALRLGQRAGAGLALQSVARGIRKDILKRMAEDVLANAVRQAALQAAVVAFLDRLLPHLVGPVLVPWLEQRAVARGVRAEVKAVLDQLPPGLRGAASSSGGAP